MMTFPIYGKINNVPNYKPDKIYMAYVTAMEWNIPRTSGLTWWKILSDFLQESPRYTKHPTGDLHLFRPFMGWF